MLKRAEQKFNENSHHSAIDLLIRSQAIIDGKDLCLVLLWYENTNVRAKDGEVFAKLLIVTTRNKKTRESNAKKLIVRYASGSSAMAHAGAGRFARVASGSVRVGPEAGAVRSVELNLRLTGTELSPFGDSAQKPIEVSGKFLAKAVTVSQLTPWVGKDVSHTAWWDALHP